MECLHAIQARRSVRRYTRSAVSSAVLRAVIRAGTDAPSGLNNQPWKFLILRAAEKDGLAGFTSYGHILKNAPAAICVFLDTTLMYDRDKDSMAIGACIQNMLLAARAAGLGTCWLGEILKKKKQAARYLHVPRTCELMAVVVIGVPQRFPKKTSRKKLSSVMIAR